MPLVNFSLKTSQICKNESMCVIDIRIKFWRAGAEFILLLCPELKEGHRMSKNSTK